MRRYLVLLILQVDVGNLLRFKACVLYTEVERADRPLIHIEVVAYVTQPEARSSEVHKSCAILFYSIVH